MYVADAWSAGWQERLCEMNKELEAINGGCGELEHEVVSKKEEMDRKVREKEGQGGAKLKTLEAASTDLSKSLVKETSAWQHKKETYEQHKKALSKINKDVQAMEKDMSAKKAKVEKAVGTVSSIQAEVVATQQSIADLERQRDGLLAGCDAESQEGDKSVADQLSYARSRIAHFETEMKTLSRRVEHYKVEVAEARLSAGAAGKEVQGLEGERRKAEQAVEQLDKELGGVKFDEARDKAVRAEIGPAQQVVEALREEVDRLSGQVSNLEVQFDHNAVNPAKVHGIVASLVTLKKEETALALEVACGARLYQLVVQDEETGKQMLSLGGLKKRVTIIPLNKIDQSTVSSDKVKAAKDAVGNRASLALSLVGCEKELEPAIKYVFGRTFVCQDVEAAKTCALSNPNIRTKSVTLEGDLFDPAGTLTGGSRGPPGSSLLLKFARLIEKRAELADKEALLQALIAEAKGMDKAKEDFRRVTNKLSMAKHELTLIAERISANPYMKAAEEVRVKEEAVANFGAEMDRIKKDKASNEADIKRLEATLKRLETSQDSEIAAKEKQLAAAKKKLTEVQGKLKATRDENESILLQSEADVAELASLKAQAVQADEELQGVAGEVSTAESAVADCKASYDEAMAELNSVKDEIKKSDKETAAAHKEIEKMRELIDKERVAAKKQEHAIERFKKDSKDASKVVDKMLREHGWIVNERHLFNKPGGDYDFGGSKAEAAQKTLESLKTDQDNSGKKVNKKVEGMFERAEQEFDHVVNKKRIIENDKAKIELVIEELDEKKNQALKVTWAKVNRDFSSIFKTLLPNARAKLEPPEGGTVLDGLVLRVGFGDCWKESLSELSGGQRSLLALSLILSLLLFKPAPMYILDEIDAALDLSHTQNIGSMLKAHFKKSQFIIVSLKEGMFNNANVLFRTKFVDGVSTVMRSTPGVR